MRNFKTELKKEEVQMRLILDLQLSHATLFNELKKGKDSNTTYLNNLKKVLALGEAFEFDDFQLAISDAQECEIPDMFNVLFDLAGNMYASFHMDSISKEKRNKIYKTYVIGYLTLGVAYLDISMDEIMTVIVES